MTFHVDLGLQTSEVANVAEQLFSVIYLRESTDILLRIWPVEIMNRMINLECREGMRIKSGARGGCRFWWGATNGSTGHWRPFGDTAHIPGQPGSLTPPSSLSQ